METSPSAEAIQVRVDPRRVDPRIVYPCYKSFDELLDIERLKSLNDYIEARIRGHARKEGDDFFLNEHRLDPASPYKPGVREIWLTKTRSGVSYDYLDLDKPELWERTEAAEEFGELMDFVETLPFQAIGRLLIIYDHTGNPVPAHRDHLNIDLCHEFIWLRTNRRKPFYLLDKQTNTKVYVESLSAWFDTVNQYHGTDSCRELSFSVRVDGIFTDELRRQIPVPIFNNASRPALWACAGA